MNKIDHPDITGMELPPKEILQCRGRRWHVFPSPSPSSSVLLSSRTRRRRRRRLFLLLATCYGGGGGCD
jgi:hypothetical protein